ncbi:MAG: hypothetical protein JJE55_01645 [Flavobacteriaceae bacterium]|nr:hypothetical protein [Flavobacteriaceae bacterium]
MKENKAILKIAKTISLPIVIETHAVLVCWDEVVYILINVLANKETILFKLNASLDFEKMAQLPLLSTSATICKKQLIVTGADFEGKPMIIAINNSGEIQWQNTLEFTPTIWPLTTCSNKLFIAWQENTNQIERGNLNLVAHKIERLSPISVSSPPAILFPLKETIFAAISEKNKTTLINLISNKIANLDISQQITIGETTDAIFYGWLEPNTVFLKFLKNDKLVDFPINKASLGKLKAISGKEATFWLQKQESTIDEDNKWQSVVIQENTDVFEIDGFVFSVIAWKDSLAVIQNSKLILLKKQPPK